MKVPGFFRCSSNVEYLLTRPGLIKLTNLALGLVTLGVGIHGVNNSNYNEIAEEELENEVTYESVIIGTFVISFFYLAVLCLNDDVANSNINRYVDTIWHAVAGKSLLVSGILLIVSARHIQGLAVCKTYHYFIRAQSEKCQLHDYKILGGIFGILNGILYEVTAYFAYTEEHLT